ncbi:type II toxin-antitoxin system RelE family toxin [Candidatus Electrothrix sp.]|uniref:type II toxin-antitoxin system RelE family toxin n=1 Tax=Candidatus Electrothrix sp. TaxID=2170559 RepID=UPI004057931F
MLRSAQKQIRKIDQKDQSRIIAVIASLAEQPRPAGSKKLSGRPAWRIRIGPYRVIYEINDGNISVLVVAVGHRREIYRL